MEYNFVFNFIFSPVFNVDITRCYCSPELFFMFFQSPSIASLMVFITTAHTIGSNDAGTVAHPTHLPFLFLNCFKLNTVFLSRKEKVECILNGLRGKNKCS